MDYKIENDKDRSFYSKDCKDINTLLQKVRKALKTGAFLNIGSNPQGIVFKPNETMVFIALFQSGLKSIRFGASKADLQTTLNACVKGLRSNKNFNLFNTEDENSCRIMLEYITESWPVPLNELQPDKFDEKRYEPGITGIQLKYDNGKSVYYLPTDGVLCSNLYLKQMFLSLSRKTPIANITNKISERKKLLLEQKDFTSYVIKSRAFVTYKDKTIPIYRGNILYPEFSYGILYKQFMASLDYIVKNQQEDGRFLYYYDATTDTRTDHEHPGRTEDNLYYNDLRHCGGVITLLRAYELTGDEKYLPPAKRGIDWCLTILEEHDTEWGKGAYMFYNQKGKLGGTGILLAAIMRYRMLTGDKSYDDVIKKCTCHLLSRVDDEGEFYGYYIHPGFQNGAPLLKMNEEEKRGTFSFFYPGEALLGLALFTNHFKEDPELTKEVKRISKRALDWLMNVRPIAYADLFASLPSDAWLMQAIEEWYNDEDFRDESYTNFVFNDLQAMYDHMYKRDDSPYIDYEGSFYFYYGEHYYISIARSEGMIAAYYLAKRMGNDEHAEWILNMCKTVARAQFQLFNCEEYTWAHKRPDKSFGGMRFKATRQWLRVDSIQHNCCFLARLFAAENKIPCPNYSAE